MNESITKDSILIWDEPEANMNPNFLETIVECLLELSRQGVQIFISTHNYIFSQYFDIKRQENDNVLFHALYRIKNSDIKLESNTYFDKIKNNDITKTFNKLLDEVYEFIGD